MCVCVCVCVRERERCTHLTVEIQIHEHSVNVNLGFFAYTFVLLIAHWRNHSTQVLNKPVDLEPHSWVFYKHCGMSYALKFCPEE